MNTYELEILAFQHFMHIHPIIGWSIIIGSFVATFAGFVLLLVKVSRN